MLQNYLSLQGADLKNNKTTKQESHQEYYCFLAEQFLFLTNRNGETIPYLLPIGRNKIVHQENYNIIDEILVSLFYCF